MLNILTHAHASADEREVLLDGLPRRDGLYECIRAEEVPGVKAGEVLQGAENFVATDYTDISTSWSIKRRFDALGLVGIGRTGGGDEAEVVRDVWVIYDCVGDHCERCRFFDQTVLCKCLNRITRKLRKRLTITFTELK